MTHRILVVDDDPLVLRSVERSLRRAGFHVQTAQSGAAALEVARQSEVDLALVDFELGAEDGLTLLGSLRAQVPNCLRVLMTGNRDFPVIVEAVNNGEVVKVLNKPFQANHLVGMVRSAIDASRERDQRATAKLIEGAMAERRALADCLHRRALRLAVQPIVQTTPGGSRVFAYEGLLRPTHESFAHAGEVLSAAERAGRLSDVGAQVFELAAEWLTQIPTDTMFFLNMHPVQLGEHKALIESLQPLLTSADRIVLEITERAPMQEIDGWEQAVAWITDKGFQLALDDLGAGYNSLGMLADLSPRYMKIDMNLVRGINADQRKQRLIQLLATFAQATETDAIAEGVETSEEATTLMQLGIGLLQGYFYGKPSFELANLA